MWSTDALLKGFNDLGENFMDKIEILSAKTFTGNPADGIDNFTLAVFGRIPSDRLNFYTKAPVNFKDIGSLKRINMSRLGYLIGQKPDFLWGIGNIKELLFLLFKPKRTKYVINFHTILIKNKGPWRVKTPWFLRKLLFSKANLIICPSEFSTQSVRRYFPDKNIVSILNGVDLELFNPKKQDQDYLEKKYKIDFSRPLAIFIGALQARKRPDIFIKLASLIPNVNFVAVGKQLPENDFLASAEGLKNFQWIEKMPRGDVAILFASAKIFIFPSLNESSAAVILEAMASGCVPIVSKSGGNGEFLINAESGFLIDPNQNKEQEFLEKIDILINNQDLWQKMSKNARSEAEKHSWEKVAKQYAQFLF
jgi:glycosyltransferase involved in cell wall biosynthesis